MLIIVKLLGREKNQKIETSVLRGFHYICDKITFIAGCTWNTSEKHWRIAEIVNGRTCVCFNNIIINGDACGVGGRVRVHVPVFISRGRRRQQQSCSRATDGAEKSAAPYGNWWYRIYEGQNRPPFPIHPIMVSPLFLCPILPPTWRKNRRVGSLKLRSVHAKRSVLERPGVGDGLVVVTNLSKHLSWIQPP